MVECILCLQLNQNVLECVQVDSVQWEELNVKDLIDRLWSIHSMTSQSWVCSICWKELKCIHKFYTRIKEVHNHFKPLVKTENDPLEEEIKPKDLIFEMLMEPEIVIGENLDTAVVIKQEKEDLCIEQNDGESNKGYEKNYDVCSFIDEDSGDSSADNESSDSDGDLPLIRGCKSKRSQKKRTKRNITDKDMADVATSNLEDARITSTRNFSNHPKTKHTEYDKFLKQHFKITCNNCQMPFEKFRMLCKHYSMEHKEQGFVMCCETKFFKRKLLVDHINYHLNPEYFKCKHCEKLFSKRIYLMRHLKTHDEMKYCCDVCDKKFVERFRLDRHKLTHMAEEDKKFPCNECGKFFANDNLLTLHQRAVHLNVYAKVCEICGQIMPDSHTFKFHMEKHDPTTPTIIFKCDVCGLILSGKRTLKRHKDLKHPVDGKRDYTCHICLKISPNMKALKKHIQDMHEMRHSFKCTVCEKTFKRSYSLKAHMSTHTGESLYHCPWCPKKFNSNGNMHNHRKKAHPNEWEEERRKKYSGNLPHDSQTVPSITSNSQ